jgi:maltose/moltooligosaccharide transporter
MLDIQRHLTNSFYVLLSLPATAMGFALSVQISALSWILSTQYGFDLHSVGLVWAAGPLAGIIGQVLIGVISDKVWFFEGRRRPFILFGGLLAALMLQALTMIGVIQRSLGLTSIVVVATAVALTLDLAINISFNPTRAIIADVTPEGEQRTKGYTWMQTISGLFGAAAYLISVYLGNYVLIGIGVLLVAIFSIMPVFFIQEPREMITTSTDDHESAHGTNISELLKIYGAHALSWLGVQSMFIYAIAPIKQMMPLASSDDLGKVISMSFFLLNTIAFIIPSLVLQPLTHRIGRVKTHGIAVGLMALAYFGMKFLALTPAILYACMAIAGIGWGAVVSLPFAIMSENVERGRMGFYMGIFNLSVVLPQLIASYFFGKLIDGQADKTYLWVLCGVSLLLSAIAWLFVKEQKVTTTGPIITSGGH